MFSRLRILEIKIIIKEATAANTAAIIIIIIIITGNLQSAFGNSKHFTTKRKNIQWVNIHNYTNQ